MTVWHLASSTLFHRSGGQAQVGPSIRHSAPRKQGSRGVRFARCYVILVHTRRDELTTSVEQRGYARLATSTLLGKYRLDAVTTGMGGMAVVTGYDPSQPGGCRGEDAPPRPQHAKEPASGSSAG